MARPQVENGHVDIANELLDAIIKARLCSYEHSVFWAIVRKTYGWHKKADLISYSQLEELTGLDRRHIARTIKSLIRRNMITTCKYTGGIEYAVQKDYDQWQNLRSPLPKEAMAPTIANSGNTPLPKEATKPLPKEATTKTNKTTIQKQVPDWLDEVTWLAFLEMRKKKRASPTDHAKELIIKKLSQWQGQDPNKILEQSIMNNWTDVYPIKEVSQKADRILNR
uniref:Putative DNA replication initiation protein n=1 Tax=viral metagenome TaxID=1070528 RepID=A0A6H2A2R2_9ZZZZ